MSKLAIEDLAILLNLGYSVAELEPLLKTVPQVAPAATMPQGPAATMPQGPAATMPQGPAATMPQGPAVSWADFMKGFEQAAANAIGNAFKTAQVNNMVNAQQPRPQTADEALASVLMPGNGY